MTTHYEVASARDTAVEAVQPGTKLGADPLAQPALVFRSDEVFLVAGTPAELLAFTDRARVAAASLAGGGAGAHRFIVVVESEHPDADAIVHAHALAMMEELDADGRTRGSVQVATGAGAEARGPCGSARTTSSERRSTSAKTLSGEPCAPAVPRSSPVRAS